MMDEVNVMEKAKLTKESMTHEDMYALLPELKLVQNEKLRETCADVWMDVLEAGGWFDKEGWGKFPNSITMRDDCPENLLTHTGVVTLASAAAYDAMAALRGRVGDCNRDVVVAGALLHDVGKLIEYSFGENGRPYRTTRKFRHPMIGAYYAQMHKLPEDIVHLVLTHSAHVSPEGPRAYNTPESRIVKAIDDMCYGYVELFCAANPQ